MKPVYDLHPDRLGTGCRILTGLLKTNPTEGDLRLPTGASYQESNHRFILGGTYTGTPRVFSGWNVKAAQAYIEVTAKGWIIEDCELGPSKDGTGVLNNQNYPIKIANGAASWTSGDENSRVVVQYCNFDGYDSASNTYHGSAALLFMQGFTKVNGVLFQYSDIRNMGQDNVNGRGDDCIVRWLYSKCGGLQTGAHCDPLQFWHGDRLHYHSCYVDFTPTIIDPGVAKIGTHGRTHACFLECFGDNTSINDAVVENLYVPGGSTLDVDGLPNHYTFGAALDAGTGSVGTSLSNNQFNNNAVDYGTAIMHPGSLAIPGAVSGTGNRRISNNTAIANF